MTIVSYCSELLLLSALRKMRAKTALVTLATAGLFNDVLCPREFELPIQRNAGPAGLNVVPSLIERGNQDVSGVRIKDAAPTGSWRKWRTSLRLRCGRRYAALISGVWRVLYLPTTDGLPGKMGTHSMFVPFASLHIKLKEDCRMMKITLAVAAAAAVLTTDPPATPAKGQELKMAQGVDIQIGRDRYDRYDRYDRDRRRNDATVGIGPGGVTIGPRQRCRMVTTTIERGDRTITRRERRCD
jgi:hypothetical protein